MKKTLLKTALLAFAGAAFVTATASAQQAFVIGFQQVGNATDIAGTVTLANFTSVQTFDLGTVGSAFQSVFNNANWSTDGTILWGMAGTNSATDSTLRNYISSPQTVGGNESPVLGELTSSQSLGAQGNITGAFNGTTATFTNTPIAGSTVLATQALSTNAQAWQRYLAGGSVAGGADYGYYGNHATEANFGNGVSGMTLDIYQLAKNTAGVPSTNLGDFSLLYNSQTNDLTLTFTPDISEVPEPSTYAMISLALVGALVFHLRGRAAKAAKA